MRYISIILILSSLLFSQELNKMLASDAAAGDSFGHSVAISGNTIVVGSPLSNNPETESGSAYVYEKNDAGLYVQVAKLKASNGSERDWFGKSVAIDGNTIVIGATANEYVAGLPLTGVLYVYEKPASGWANTSLQNAILRVSDSSPDHVTLNDGIGESVSISGNTIVAGSQRYSYGNKGQVGAAYIFTKPSTHWVNMNKETAKLTTSEGVGYDKFGTSVAISGNTIVIGAYIGKAYVYIKPAGGWKNDTTYNAKLIPSNAENDYSFATSVSIDNNTVVVGSPLALDDTNAYIGTAYVYEKPAAGWSGSMSETAQLTTDEDASGGKSISISEGKIVMGAPDDGIQSHGAAYIFEKPSSGWKTTGFYSDKIMASDIAIYDYFGTSVSVSGDLVVVGAPLNSDAGQSSGSAYVFKESPTPIPNFSPVIIMYLLN